MIKESYAEPYNEVICEMLNVSRMEFTSYNKSKRAL